MEHGIDAGLSWAMSSPGKTGNYTGLICKAADAGYKIIIVLAGLHNNLRSQTQMRLDEGFLGYETRPIADDIREIGVGLVDRDPSIRPNYVTNRTNNGDFSTARANTLGITPEQRPWLFVVKKNKTVLERLLGWVRHHVAEAQDENGRKIVKRLPLLLIDDEADHASVDTGEQIFDEDGIPDPEHQPTAINSLTARSCTHSLDPPMSDTQRRPLPTSLFTSEERRRRKVRICSPRPSS